LKSINLYFKANNWIDQVGGWVKDNAGIDVTTHENTKNWFKNVVTRIGADVDTSGNCYIVFEKSGFEAVKRGCGAFGEVGKIGGQLVDWLQGGEITLNSRKQRGCEGFSLQWCGVSSCKPQEN